MVNVGKYISPIECLGKTFVLAHSRNRTARVTNLQPDAAVGVVTFSDLGGSFKGSLHSWKKDFTEIHGFGRRERRSKNVFFAVQKKA